MSFFLKYGSSDRSGKSEDVFPLDGMSSKLCYLIGPFSWNEGGKGDWVHQPSSRKYKCEWICFEAHTIILICSYYDCRSQGKDE